MEENRGGMFLHTLFSDPLVITITDNFTIEIVPKEEILPNVRRGLMDALKARQIISRGAWIHPK
jgi:hypothetical protein